MNDDPMTNLAAMVTAVTLVYGKEGKLRITHEQMQDAILLALGGGRVVLDGDEEGYTATIVRPAGQAT